MLHDHTHKALAPGNSVYFIHESGFTDGWLIPIGLGWVALQLSWEQLIQPAGRGQLGAAPRDPHLPPWSGHWPGHCSYPCDDTCGRIVTENSVCSFSIFPSSTQDIYFTITYRHTTVFLLNQIKKKINY